MCYRGLHGREENSNDSMAMAISPASFHLISHRNPNPNSLPLSMAMASSQPRPRPNLSPIKSRQLDLLLPWSGSGNLVSHEFGTPMDWAFRLSASLASTFCVFRYSYTIAALASLFWIWGPMWSAAFRSCQLRLRFPHAGVWQARVLAANPISQTLSRPSDSPAQKVFGNLSSSSPLFYLEIGDDSSARLQIQAPAPKQTVILREGEPAELLVLSDRLDLSRFKAVRDIYFPRIGIWISQDPLVERAAFESLSMSMSSEFVHKDALQTQHASKMGSSYMVEIPSMGQRPLINAANTQNIRLLREPRKWNMSYDLDWDNSEERGCNQSSNLSGKWPEHVDE